jgi:phage baseplate assembly protein W
VWECIEEPNTQALSFMIKTFVKNSIVSWEPRITALDVQSERVYDKIHIQIRFSIQNQTSISELNFEYNPSNNTINVN